MMFQLEIVWSLKNRMKRKLFLRVIVPGTFPVLVEKDIGTVQRLVRGNH